MMTKMNRKIKIIVFLISIFLVVFLFGVSVSAAETRISPKDPVTLEVGIGGFKQVTGGIAQYIGQIYWFATAIVGGLAVVMIIIGAVQYSSSAGNKAAIGSAKETITSAIIGLVIVLMAYLILGSISGDFVNIANPRLKTITISDQNSKGSYYCDSDTVVSNQYICKLDPSGQKTSGGCTASTQGLQCTPGGPPPKTVTCSELEATREGCEKASDYWCQYCELPNGEKSCIKNEEHCGKECSENCMPENDYFSCLTQNYLCESACSPLSFVRDDVNGCRCGNGPADLAGCQAICGYGNESWIPPRANPDITNPEVGTCSCRDKKTLTVKQSLVECEKNKEKWTKRCVDDFKCGPGGPGGPGRDAYCCTGSQAPTP